MIRDRVSLARGTANAIRDRVNLALGTVEGDPGWGESRVGDGECDPGSGNVGSGAVGCDPTTLPPVVDSGSAEVASPACLDLLMASPVLKRHTSGSLHSLLLVQRLVDRFFPSVGFCLRDAVDGWDSMHSSVPRAGPNDPSFRHGFMAHRFPRGRVSSRLNTDVIGFEK